MPVRGVGWEWFHGFRTRAGIASGRDMTRTTTWPPIATGRMSLFPIAAVGKGAKGAAVGLDIAHPAFFRVGMSADLDGAKDAGELYIAFDLGLAPERPEAKVKLVLFDFDARDGFRGAWQRYMELFPQAFSCRTPKQGVWMPFAKISKVERWEDFGFKFKEANNETEWDDAHGIITFRYTGPMTTWTRLPKGRAVTYESGVAHLRARANAGDFHARTVANSVFHDERGRMPTYLGTLPWNRHGVGWRVNGSPWIEPKPNYFAYRWNERIKHKLYGPNRKGDLDGEYIDTSEGTYPFPLDAYLDFRREHFAGMRRPLTFSASTHTRAIFGGCVAFEYAKGMADDVHEMGKLMMANGTPSRLPWLAPLLDVLGNETNWRPRGKWRPMSDDRLLYRRALCGPKPFCFLMNTNFDEWTRDMSERYMKRCLAYGMFPGFFSADASSRQYFTRPALYNRDRPLFKKYVPLVKRVAEAGWRPITRARSSVPKVYVERFGSRYLTVFNDTRSAQTVTITLDRGNVTSATELVTGGPIRFDNRKAVVQLAPEDVALLDLQ